jgi:pyruvate dehydrogenase E2 component (dihydrolipoamide acetyltransferase)
MQKTIIMPKFEMSQETGTIARWLKNNGDVVAKGDAVLEVETDKITMEVESPASGVLSGISAQPGEVIAIGTVIAEVVERAEQGAKGAKSARGAELSAPLAPIAPLAPSSAPLAPSSAPQAPSARPTPLAQKMAAEHGLDLTAIAGSGKDGQITKGDVEAAIAAGVTQPAISAVPAARRLARELNIDLRGIKGSGPNGRIQSGDLRAEGADSVSAPLSPLRRTIAQRMTQSMREAPQFNLSTDVNMDRLLAVAEDWKAAGANDPAAPKVTVTALLIKICAWALARNRAINAAFMGDHIAQYADVNIGVAVAIDDGLIVPVIHNADRLGVGAIAARLADLSARARSGKLTPADIKDGTFSISNLGMFAVDRFTAIVNPPQAAILAVGRASKRFVPDAHDQPVLARISTLTVSADHRAVDGAIVGRFLGDLQLGVEKPGLLL